jgi:hypothetical protein
VPTGKVAIRSPRVASGQVGGQRVLLNLPLDRFVVLYPHAERIWDRIEGGEHDIAKLVAHHVSDTRVPIETAAYQVITFLEELRAEGFVEFELPSERDAAPLIDTSVSVTDTRLGQLMRLLQGRRPFEGTGQSTPARVLDDPDPAITLADLRALFANVAQPAAAAAPPAKRVVVLDMPSAAITIDQLEHRDDVREHAPPHFTDRRLVVLRAPSPDLRLDELEQLATMNAGAIAEARRGKTSLLDSPRGDITLGDLETAAVEQALIIVVIIIVFGPIIIVIVVIGEPGPSSGKSRQSCKTMCV